MAVDIQKSPRQSLARGRSSLQIGHARRVDFDLWIDDHEDLEAFRRMSRTAHFGWPEMLAEYVRSFLTYYVRLDSYKIALLIDIARLQQTVAREASHGALHDLGPDWLLDQPLYVTIENYDDHSIARIPELSAYGEGTTEPEALADLRQNVIEGRAGLEGLEPGSELAETWIRLIHPVKSAQTA